MKTSSLLAISFLFLALACTTTTPDPTPVITNPVATTPVTPAAGAAPKKVYLLGHSLVNLDMPFQLKELRKTADASYDYRLHVNIGAALKAQWLAPANFNSNPIWEPTLGRDVEYGTDFEKELKTTNYQAFVFTEALPIRIQGRATTVEYGRNFYDLAVKANPNIQVYFYQTWEWDAAFGTGATAWAKWRQRLGDDQSYWEGMAADFSTNTPTGKKVLMVPGGLAMATLYDKLQKGSVGRLKQISDVFDPDNIHLNNTGNYFIACVIYATLFKTSPENLPVVKAGPYQNNQVETDAATRLELQKLAYQTVCGYAKAGACQ